MCMCALKNVHMHALKNMYTCALKNVHMCALKNVHIFSAGLTSAQQYVMFPSDAELAIGQCRRLVFPN